MTSTYEAELCLPNLPSAVKKVHIIDNMDKFLLSLGSFCDNDYTATLTKDTISLRCNHDKNLNLNGFRDYTTEIWLIDISPQKDTVPSQHSQLDLRSSSTTESQLDTGKPKSS